MSEALLVALAALLALALVVRATSGAPRAGLALAGALVVSLFASLALGLGGSLRAPLLAPRERPSPRPSEAEYVTSAACLPCHASEHASFTRSYHRTMTEDATRATVKALAAPGPHLIDGRNVSLEARGDAVWATMPDPDLVARAPRAYALAPEVTRRVVLTTGSHREQTYWVKGEREGELRLVPLVWLVDEARVIPRHDAFLTPADEPLGPTRWNSNCIACHAVAGEPGHDEGRDAFDTRAAELGVACEACHGPGRRHVEAYRDPAARYAARRRRERGDLAADPTIVQPAKLPPERAAAVCGQCHSYAFPRDEARFWSSGYAKTFRPGDTLDASRTLLMRDAPGGPEVEAEPDSLFWKDGTIRVGGREYNGLVASPCYLRGEGARKLTCLSCHAMHEGEPAGQLAPSRAGDRACTQAACHASTAPHTHHAAGSPGAACVSCHMPRTSYALFHGVRSHRITSPSVARTLATGEPSACNLCHLDRSLAWTSATLASWYGRPAAPVPDERAAVAEGAWLALRGDAAIRVSIAAALGESDALAAGVDARTALLPELARDPYAAVRAVAERSSRALGRAAASRMAADATHTPMDDRTLRALLLTAESVPDVAARQRHLRERDQRRITIAE